MPFLFTIRFVAVFSVAYFDYVTYFAKGLTEEANILMLEIGSYVESCGELRFAIMKLHCTYISLNTSPYVHIICK